jgi:histidyl-tRNA synthetase
VLSNSLTQSTPLKFFASGPVFRYERPQKGRYRQFHQIDAEILGVSEPQADIELIALAHRLLNELDIGERVSLEINTLGDPETRVRYRAMLVEYYSKWSGHLSEDSLRRLKTNPLRILDSKDQDDIEINKSAPVLNMYLNLESNEFFGRVKDGLGLLGIQCRENPRLVRGLDYYTHTVFEFITTDLGSQGTVLAGGRYDGLVELMGGPQMPGVGWAAGIERLAMLIDEPSEPVRPLALVPLGGEAWRIMLPLSEKIRDEGFAVDLGYSGNLSRRMRRANRINARAALLIGDDELAKKVMTLRDLDSGEQAEIPLGNVGLPQLIEKLKALG